LEITSWFRSGTERVGVEWVPSKEYAIVAAGLTSVIDGRTRHMGLLTADMKRVVEEQRLGFVATVCRDGTPNLSPKGTTAVWDDDHLVFANIRSPGTLANLRQNASVEINVVDPFCRRGYRFKGVASVLESGALYDRVIAFYQHRGSTVSLIREVVLVRVQQAEPVDSPAYDLGLSEDEVRSRWERHFESLRTGRPASPAGE
jgi:predicted pyridoxine 5'-phosphate oxidase superfamily flavin-nucleotide-binding protein